MFAGPLPDRGIRARHSRSQRSPSRRLEAPLITPDRLPLPTHVDVARLKESRHVYVFGAELGNRPAVGDKGAIARPGYHHASALSHATRCSRREEAEAVLDAPGGWDPLAVRELIHRSRGVYSVGWYECVVADMMARGTLDERERRPLMLVTFVRHRLPCGMATNRAKRAKKLKKATKAKKPNRECDIVGMIPSYFNLQRQFEVPGKDLPCRGWRVSWYRMKCSGSESDRPHSQNKYSLEASTAKL